MCDCGGGKGGPTESSVGAPPKWAVRRTRRLGASSPWRLMACPVSIQPVITTVAAAPAAAPTVARLPSIRHPSGLSVATTEPRVTLCALFPRVMPPAAVYFPGAGPVTPTGHAATGQYDPAGAAARLIDQSHGDKHRWRWDHDGALGITRARLKYFLPQRFPHASAYHDSLYPSG